MKGLFFRNFVNNWLTKFESLPKSQALDCNYRNNTKKWAFCVVPRTGQKLHSHFFSPIDFIGGKQWISFGKTSSDPLEKKHKLQKLSFLNFSLPKYTLVQWYKPSSGTSLIFCLRRVCHTHPFQTLLTWLHLVVFMSTYVFCSGLLLGWWFVALLLKSELSKSRRRSFACRRTETFQEKKSAKTQKVC